MAIPARSSSVTNWSSGRICITSVRGQFLRMLFARCFVRWRLMFFSREWCPAAPWSLPPCPASIATMKLLYFVCFVVRHAVVVRVSIVSRISFAAFL